MSFVSFGTNSGEALDSPFVEVISSCDCITLRSGPPFMNSFVGGRKRAEGFQPQKSPA